jgi:hypothetical protein
MNTQFQLTFRRSIANGEYYCTISNQNTTLSDDFGTGYGYRAGTYEWLINLINYATDIFGTYNYLRPISSGHFSPWLKPIRLKPSEVNSIMGYFSARKFTSIEFYETEIIGMVYDGPNPVFVKFSVQELMNNVNNLVPVEITPSKNERNGKPLYTCERCIQSSEDKNFIKECSSSTGKKFKLCRRCGQTTRCESCNFKELQNFVKQAIEIDDNGEDKRFYICAKCKNRDYNEHGCGYYYKSSDGKCPCQYKQDFKSFIQAHNADVLTHCQMDQYCNELFGIEIEAGTLIKNRKFFPEIAKSTNELIGANAILKYDSSIDFINKNEGIKNNYRGFEVVTRPMIYKNALLFLRKFCKERHPLLRSWEVGTCGLHIHVSRACLRPFEIGKILEFVNAKSNRNFVRMIAKREDKRFAKFIPKRILDYNKNTPGGPNGVPLEHYEAVNTSKPYTIEFRIFRGTLNPRTLMSYMQFVKSLIEFVKVTAKADLTHKKYADFLFFSTEKSQFRELKKRIKSENLTKIAEEGEI